MKITITIIRLLVLLCINLLFSSLAVSATYYVRSDADPGGDGTTDATSGASCAWDAIADVNTKNFTTGDIVNVRAGDVFSDNNLTLAGVASAITSLTIQGADFGGKTIASDGRPLFPDGDVKFIEITNSNIGGLVLKDLAIDGDRHINKVYNLSISNVAGVTLDGIYMDGTRGGYLANETGQNGIGILDGVTGTVEVRNCIIHSYGPADAGGNPQIPSIGSDSLGIIITANATAVYIHDNTIYNMNADGIQLYETAGPIYVYDNTIYNCGEDGIDVKGADNNHIYSNTFYRAAGFSGEGGSGGFITGVIVHEGGVTGASNNIIYGNTIYNETDMIGIRVGSASGKAGDGNIVKRNKIYGCKGSISLGNNSSNTVVAFNVIYNPLTTGAVNDAGGISENSYYDGATRIINNTIYRGTGTAETAIMLASNKNTIVRNNIVHWDYAGDYVFYADTAGDPAVVDHNVWYNPSNVVKLKYEGTEYGTANWATWTGSHTGESYADPELTNVVSYSFTLQSTSPCINAGIDPFSDGDGDQTDYAGTPVWSDTTDAPVGHWADGVEIGAYGYSTPPPQSTTVVFTGGTKTLTTTGGSQTLSW